MELKQSYGQTGVELIPKDWSIVSMAKHASLKARIGWQALTTEEYLNSGTYYLVTGTDFIGGRVYWQTCHFVDEWRYNQDRNIQLQNGDVLLTKDGTIGKVGYVENLHGPATLNSGVFVIRPLQQAFFPLFLFYVLTSKAFDEFLSKITAGSTITHLYQKDFVTFEFSAPSIEEQRAIATVLSDVDALLTAQEKLIAKKRNIKQAAMQQLLTGKQRLPGFTGAWEVRRLGELGHTYGGLTGKNKADFSDGKIPYIPFMNVMRAPVIDTSDFDYVNLSEKDIQNKASKGDMFFNGSSETPEEVGMCSVLLEDVPNLYLNSFCFGFKFHAGINANGLFFAYWFRCSEGRKAMSVLAQGATRYNIAKSAFLKLNFNLPSEEEQTAIATILSDMDADLTALEQQRDKTLALKQGMMQELLTGRIRLV